MQEVLADKLKLLSSSESDKQKQKHFWCPEVYGEDTGLPFSPCESREFHRSLGYGSFDKIAFDLGYNFVGFSLQLILR